MRQQLLNFDNVEDRTINLATAFPSSLTIGVQFRKFEFDHVITYVRYVLVKRTSGRTVSLIDRILLTHLCLPFAEIRLPRMTNKW